MHQVIELKVLPRHRLLLRFDDGLEGEVDLTEWLERGVFRKLRDPSEFSRAAIGEFGEVRWGDDLDLDPDSLHEWASRAPAAFRHA